ncbi:MAG: insulinase family protein [Clostridia bacterium]|nr:insulinase family protein [Clostridia bacterium]
MKKLLSLLTALVMLASVCAGVTAEEAAPAVSGFTVKETRTFDMLGADITVYEHDKTGALVMLIANDDLNRTFEMAFRTPVPDSRGIPHVFEHATLGGSEKYPSKALWFNLSYQTYNTYMNAATYPFMTVYPVASLSEEQLLLYADYYTDSCLNPSLMTDESIFREEAWRYAMTDAESPLTYAGTVYSEMKGAYTIDQAATFNMMTAAFPGSRTGNVSGGKPSDIPDMTWDDLKNYHDSYYHPSNSVTFLYGKFEHPEAFLSLLDGYFSAYDKKEFDLTDTGYTPVTGYTETVFDYPATADFDTENGSRASYIFVCGNADEDTVNKLDMFTTLMGAPFSPFGQKMKEQLPAATVSCYVGIDGPETYVVFNADGIDPEDKDTFRAIVEESVREVSENGFAKEDADAVIASLRLSVLLAGETSDAGVNNIANIAYYWAATGDLFGFMNYVDSLESFDRYASDTTFPVICREYLANNSRRAMALTVPVPGQTEADEQALADRLAAVKAEMTDEEIAAIVAQTNAEQETEDTSGYVRRLTAVTVESLPEDVRQYEIDDATDENGLRRVLVKAAADGVGTASLLLDAQGLTQDQIHYFKLLTEAIGDLPTTKHSYQEITSLCTRYLYGGEIRISAMGTPEGDCHPYLRAGFTALNEDMQAGYDLLYELIFETELSDAELLKNEITYLKNTTRQSIVNNIYQIVLYRALAAGSATSAYFSYASYIDYYEFLCNVEAMMDTEPETVMANLEAVRQALNNSRGAISGFIGSEADEPAHRAAADSFFAKLDSRETEKQIYAFPPVTNNEAVIVEGNVQYNLVAASMADLSREFSGDMDAVCTLVTDSFLMPMLRDQYGVYAVLHGADRESMYILSYRDPNITETFDVYAQLGTLVATLKDLDQETLDGYILSSYAVYANASGELTDGLSVYLNYLSGHGQDETVACMRELKAVTADQVAAYADTYETLWQNGIKMTAGSASAITANAGLYANVINPFGVQDASKAVFDDVDDASEAAVSVRWCYENACVFPVSDDHFGVADQATLGQLAAAMYIAVGGTYDPEEAITFLAGYGILPADSADTPLTREKMATYLYCFCSAMGVPVEEVPMDGYTDTAEITQGLEGYIGCMLGYGLMQPASEGVFAPAAPATVQDLCDAMYVLLAE